MVKSFLIVGIGGALGTILRFTTTKLLASYQLHFPIATFAVNIIGCFLIGLFLGLAEKNEWMQGNMLLLLVTGFCGGFTTFSAFAVENVVLLEKQFFSTALLYSLISLVLGILACKGGFLLAK